MHGVGVNERFRRKPVRSRLRWSGHVERMEGGQRRERMRSEWRVDTDINRTPVSKTRPLSSYQLTHDTAMHAWTSDIHTA